MGYKLRTGLALLVMAALMACAPAKAGREAGEATPTAAADIIARVNGEVVKRGEYDLEIESAYKRFHQSGQMIDGTMYEQLKSEVREQLINLVLMDQYSQKLGIEVDDANVEQYFQRAVDQYTSRKAFEKSLKEAGLTEADIKARLKRTLAAQQVVKTQLAPKAKVAEEKVRAYYDDHPYEFEHDIQVRASHILINVHPLADDDTKRAARKKIQAAKARIDAGEDFAEVAKQVSEGPSKTNGGDLGYFGAAQMAPAFETAAFSLKPGEVSKVVTTQFGYHLIKVFDRKPAGKESYEEAAPVLRARFEREKLNTAMEQLITRLKSEAEIERFDLDAKP